MIREGGGPAGETRVRVRYAETDQMGVAYHGNYVVWLDIARTELMRNLGFPYRELEQDGLYLTVTEVEIRYGAPAHYDDEIVVRTWIEAVQSRAISFGYRLRRADDPAEKTIATARVRLIATGADGAPRTFPEHLRQRFREVVQAAG